MVEVFPIKIYYFFENWPSPFMKTLKIPQGDRKTWESNHSRTASKQHSGCFCDRLNCSASSIFTFLHLHHHFIKASLHIYYSLDLFCSCSLSGWTLFSPGTVSWDGLIKKKKKNGITKSVSHWLCEILLILDLLVSISPVGTDIKKS